MRLVRRFLHRQLRFRLQNMGLPLNETGEVEQRRRHVALLGIAARWTERRRRMPGRFHHATIHNEPRFAMHTAQLAAEIRFGDFAPPETMWARHAVAAVVAQCGSDGGSEAQRFCTDAAIIGDELKGGSGRAPCFDETQIGEGAFKIFPRVRTRLMIRKLAQCASAVGPPAEGRRRIGCEETKVDGKGAMSGAAPLRGLAAWGRHAEIPAVDRRAELVMEEIEEAAASRLLQRSEIRLQRTVEPRPAGSWKRAGATQQIQNLRLQEARARDGEPGANRFRRRTSVVLLQPREDLIEQIRQLLG